MIQVLEGLTGKNASEKATYGTVIKAKMTGNAFFPDAATVLTALNSATAALVLANTGRIATVIAEKETKFNRAVKKVALHVQNVVIDVEDDELALEMVVSAGFEGKRKGSIHISDLAAKQGREALSVNLRRKAYELKKNVGYVWQISSDNVNWTFSKFSTKAKVTIRDLVSGKRYYFRVAVVVGEEQLDYSDATDIVVK